MKIGPMIAGGGTVPLLLYVLLGPKHGNPVGLGLLMWLSRLVGGACIVLRLIGGVRARLRRGRT